MSAFHPLAEIAIKSVPVHFAGMGRVRAGIALGTLLLGSVGIQAQQSSWQPTVDERHEITKSYETSSEGGGSTGSSRGRDAIEERVIAVHRDGVELEYDLPSSATAQDRAREWMLPARVLRQGDGVLRLLNRGELEARLERWLRAANWTREVCGRWIFTWNAFRIDCDPELVLDVVRAYDLRPVDLREGATYRVPEARASGTLRRIPNGADGLTFRVVLDVDPDAVRRARAESDVAVGEIMRQPVTLDAALTRHAGEQISGTIEVTFETDLAGNARQQTRVTRLEIVGQAGREIQTRRDVLERSPIPPSGNQQ